jgi:hypothetical protein
MNLNVQWIVGFVDGEGCFSVSINKHDEMKLNYQVLPEFIVVQHKDDIQVLHALKKHFKCGVVRKNHGDRYCYRVRSIVHLHDIIIPFFMKHSLKTKKNIEFHKFRKIIQKMNLKLHPTKT